MDAIDGLHGVDQDLRWERQIGEVPQKRVVSGDLRPTAQSRQQAHLKKHTVLSAQAPGL